MKRVSILLLLTIYSSILLGQDSLFIRSWNKPSNKTIYKKNKKFTLQYRELYNDTNKIMQTVSLSGKLKRVTDTSLTLAISVEEIEIDFKNGKTTNIVNKYFQDPCDIFEGIHYGDELRTINFKKIEQVHSGSVKKGYIFGSTLTGISVFTALVVAPLASINYKTGNFNQSKYYTIAGSCLVGMTIGIPIILLTRDEKYYFIQTTRADKEEGYYYLSND